ncbi:calcium-binding protein [Microvirga roseola]|uniref:calcium-binding protein n=1 Tax=Microvirga roseola TaxID=2883126 RepID=UPI001E5F50C5|nr:M10 family metallopeptidase C-terminal domain-containing protein [Microvirga roseola]
MATFTWKGSYGFDMWSYSLSGLAYGDGYSRSTTKFAVRYGSSWSTRDEFRGAGFAYDADGVPISGTVKSYAGYIDGRQISSITGAKVAATTLVSAAATSSTSDDLRVFRSILSKNDVVKGGKYDDTLYGFNGKDKLIGGRGDDFLYGGKGADRFVFQSVRDSSVADGDIIMDFSRTQRDKVDLRIIDANTAARGNQAFKFIGTSEFSNKAGELRYFGTDGVVVEGDTNGDGQADFSLYLADISKVYKSYFIL